MAIHLNSADLPSQALTMIELGEIQEEKEIALQNCIGLMEDFGVEPIAARNLNSTPQSMILAINSYENERDEAKKAGLRTLILAGIAAIPLTIGLLTKTDTKSGEIIRFVIIGFSAIITIFSGFACADGFLKAGMIKDYIEACREYIKKYYPHLENRIKVPEGKARVKKK